MRRKEIFVLAERCMGCHSCELACATAHTTDRNLHAAVLRGERPFAYLWVDKFGAQRVPTVCKHCLRAPCVEVCPTGAMHKAPDTTTICDHSQCIGCWMCTFACPFGACDRGDGQVLKCDRQCLDEEGVPACVRACPTGALLWMTVEEFAAERRKPRRRVAAAAAG
ncbi:MAG: 4Fe-4S dicluster domain-containing protein [Bacillota bacterium]|nr:MAG: 4Fe-4S ferredoxin [Bacillota bacterium]